MLDDENGLQEYTKAIGYIYELVNDGTLEVGSKLPTERAIAQQLGIGRNSTREALSILHGMGIIERRQGSGNYISSDAGNTHDARIKADRPRGYMRVQTVYGKDYVQSSDKKRNQCRA